MSGEFGVTPGGHFHWKIANCSEDLSTASRVPFAKRLENFFDDFEPVARAISWCEACDSGEDYPIEAMLDALPKLKRHLQDIESDLNVYRNIARRAINKYIETEKSLEEMRKLNENT